MNKVKKVMSEFGRGKLHSGSKKGPVVKNRKQAIAIALSESSKQKFQNQKRKMSKGQRKELKKWFS